MNIRKFIPVNTMIGAIAVALLVLPAGPPAAAVEPTTYPVVIVGDSIIDRTRAAYSSKYLIDAAAGRGLGFPGVSDPGLPADVSGIEAVRRSIPLIEPGGWLVVELGTNDISQQVTTGLFLAQMQVVTDLLPDDRCLVWVLPWRERRYDRALVYQSLIGQGVREQPCWRLVAWSAVNRQIPALFQADGIHPTEAGGLVLAAMIRTAISGGGV